MTALAELTNHQTAAQASPRTMATPMANPTSGDSSTDSSSSNSATISANDFLTLLVTEMQNQDPTADTDPNEYINQLVNVNSLEQLIDINQTLGTAFGSTPSTSGTGAQPGVTTAAGPANAATPASAAASPLSTVPAAAPSSTTAPQTGSAGNLGVPHASPAANRVGHALAGRTHASLAQGTPPATQ